MVKLKIKQFKQKMVKFKAKTNIKKI